MPQSNIENRPTIALTMGDPAGVGPEVVLQAVADPELAPLARWIVVGDAAVLEMAQRITGVELHAELRDPRALAGIEEFSFGRLDARCGVAAVEYVRIATEMCLSGEADAMVTAPINKEAVSLSGRPERETASLLIGAVTMASASPERHISVAMRTYSTAATPQRASRRPKENSSIPARARGSRSSAWSSTPVIRWAISSTAASPTTIQRARGASSGSATACSTTSGPTPTGSPMVNAMVGRFSMFDWGMKNNPLLESRYG